MLDALPLPLFFGALGVVALLVGVVVIWTRGGVSGKKAFAKFESEASPSPQKVAQEKDSAPVQPAAEASEPKFEPLPPTPKDSPEPVLVNFASDQLSLGSTVPSGRRSPGASMKPFKDMAGSVVTKG